MYVTKRAAPNPGAALVENPVVKMIFKPKALRYT